MSDTLHVYSRRKGATPPPPDAVYVGRPSAWANPYRIGDKHEGRVIDRSAAVWLYECQVERFRRAAPDLFREWLAPLRGKSLVCWCKSPGEDTACHADVLLRLANEVGSETKNE